MGCLIHTFWYKAEQRAEATLESAMRSHYGSVPGHLGNTWYCWGSIWDGKEIRRDLRLLTAYHESKKLAAFFEFLCGLGAFVWLPDFIDTVAGRFYSVDMHKRCYEQYYLMQKRLEHTV